MNGRNAMRWMAGTMALALVALAAGVAAAAPEAPEIGADEAAAMQATQDACTAFRTGDLAWAERLLAPEFTLVGSDASVQSRDSALAEVRAGEPRYERFENVDMTARVWGDVGMVRGVTRLRGTAGGSPFELDVRFTDLLVRTDGRWRLVTSHVTRLPAPSPVKRGTGKEFENSTKTEKKNSTKTEKKGQAAKFEEEGRGIGQQASAPVAEAVSRCLSSFSRNQSPVPEMRRGSSLAVARCLSPSKFVACP